MKACAERASRGGDDDETHPTIVGCGAWVQAQRIANGPLRSRTVVVAKGQHDELAGPHAQRLERSAGRVGGEFAGSPEHVPRVGAEP